MASSQGSKTPSHTPPLQTSPEQQSESCPHPERNWGIQQSPAWHTPFPQQSRSPPHEKRGGLQQVPPTQVVEQQSFATVHPVPDAAIQQVLFLQVAFGSQQSESRAQESSAPVGAQHFPSSQITAPKGLGQQSFPTRFVQPVVPSARQHVPLLQVAFESQQSEASWHESEARLGAQQRPASQTTEPNSSSQQSEASVQVDSARRTQQVPPLHVAFGSQQSASTLQESSAPVGAQHFPDSQITAPKLRQQSLPTRLVHPVAPSSIQQVPLWQTAFSSQHSPAS